MIKAYSCSCGWYYGADARGGWHHAPGGHGRCHPLRNVALGRARARARAEAEEEDHARVGELDEWRD